jgi:phospholipid/cholesterol/gamma-HCH transport system substrate-binding protein
MTVFFACVTLAVLIFLMSGTAGLFTSKIMLRSYFDNAGGLREGAPVRLSGVDIGNVTNIRIVSGQALTPVQVTMKVNTKYAFALRKDSAASLSTAGFLGETYVDIDSAAATGPPAQNGDVLPIRDHPDFTDVIRTSQGTLQNMDSLLKRTDRILTFVENGQGSVGKLIRDPSLYDQLNDTVKEFRGLILDVKSGKGSIGPLLASDEAYKKVMAAVDKLNLMIDDLQQGKGTAGKLLKDEALYNNANESVANVKKLTDDINAGKGALGKFAHNQEFADKLQNTVTKLSNIADRLDAGQGTAGKILQDESLYKNTDQLMVEARNLIAAIRQDPKKYLTIKLHIF